MVNCLLTAYPCATLHVAGDYERATQLLAAAEMLRNAVGAPTTAEIQEKSTGILAAARTTLGEATFRAA